MTFEGDFLSVWPNHPHFIFLISTSMELSPVLSQSSVSEMTSGHLMTSDVDDFSEASVDKGLQLVVVLHVSEPYSRGDLTLVLKILIVFSMEGEG